MAKQRPHRAQGRPGTSQTVKSRTRTPAPSPNHQASTSSTARGRLEAFSAPWLVRMQLLPSYAIPVALALMLFLGLALPWAWTGLLLIVLGLFLSWLNAVSWPVLGIGSKLMRVLVSVVLVGLGVIRVTGLV